MRGKKIRAILSLWSRFTTPESKDLSRTWKQRDGIISRCHDLVKLAGSSFMPIDIWYIWYINVRRGARVDICVIIYDCVNKGDGEKFQVVKNVFRPCFGKHSWRCFCFNTFVLKDDFQAERKENMWSSFSLEMRNTLPRVATEKIYKTSNR